MYICTNLNLKNMETRNYEMFRFINVNRDINLGLVERLIKSILKNGFIKSRSIIVDENMAIIDGQHRFMALKQMGKPIYYEIEKGLTRDSLIDINANQLVWKQEDYVQYWAKRGVKCYQVLLDFANEHYLTVSRSVYICFGNAGNISKKIKSGYVFELNINRNSIAFAIQLCKVYCKFYDSAKLIQAFVKLYAIGNDAQIKTLISKLHLIKESVSQEEYAIQFENIINKRITDPNKKIKLSKI